MDVRELIRNGEKRSHVFYVDSSKRNRETHPSPNEYTVHFSEPFRNVFSIQLLDAAIPRTHYTVDEHKRTLAYSTSGSSGSFKTVHLAVGDYTDVELVAALNDALRGDVEVSFLSDPPERRKQLVFTAPVDRPFRLHMGSSTMAETLGFDAHRNKVLESADDPAQYKTTGVLDNMDTQTGVEVVLRDPTTVLRQHFVASATGRVGNFEMRMRLADDDDNLADPTSNATNAFAVSLRVSDASTGDLVAAISAADVRELYRESDGKVVVPQTMWAYGTQQLLRGDAEYLVTVNLTQVEHVDARFDVELVSNPSQQLYVSTNNDLQEFVRVNLFPYDASAGPTTVEQRYFGTDGETDSGVPMGLVCSLSIVEPLQSVVPTGIYNLLGDRYLILRCPEIESHIMTSVRSFERDDLETEYHTGIAKFKLSVVGFREERFDFNTLPPLEFHPIGKLPSLTFRFQNQDGAPYDFRGVNHTITLAVNYYKPINRVFSSST